MHDLAFSRRLVAWALVIVTLAALAPMLAISLYNHPFCDDYMFSQPARMAWLQTGSLWQTVEAGFRKAMEIYRGWQGCYTVSFLSALQPAIFSESLYFLVTFALVGMLVFALCYVVKVLMKDVLGLGTSETVIACCLCVLLTTQLTPDASEAFYWCNGGVAYTLMQSLLFIAFGLRLRLERSASTAKTIVLTVLSAVALFLVAGGNFSTGLFGAVVFVLTTLLAFVRKSKKRWLHLALVLLYLGCFALNVLAPGNAVRIATTDSTTSAPKAILASLLYAGMFAGKWTELALLGAAGLCVPLFITAARRCDFVFPHPLLATALGYCVFATLLTPPLYAGVYVGGGRQIDIYYYTYVLLFLVCVCYWTGYIVKKTGKGEAVAQRASYRAPLCLALCLCLLLGAMGFDRGETTQFGLRTVTGGSALRSLLNGEARRYDEAMDAREALLLDPAQSSVAVSPVEEVPEVFMDDLLSGDVPGYALPMTATYYGKTEITLTNAAQ